MCAAIAAPVLLAFSRTPTVTMFNHLLSFLGWGVVLWVCRSRVRGGVSAVLPWRQLAPMMWALALLMGAALWSAWGGAWPSSLALSGLALLAGAAAVSAAAGWARRAEDGGQAAFLAFASAVVLAGVVSALIGVLQVFAPWLIKLAPVDLVATSGIVGRAVGNLRQPNHLSSWLMWALIALVPLAQQRRFLVWTWPAAAFVAMGALMVLGVVLTASRTGVLGIVLLALWAVADRRLQRPVRWALWATPLLYVVFWFLLSLWAQSTQQTFGGEARLAEADLSSSRFTIWANTWAMVMQQPWTGVGMGQYNFAWTLTPFPGRPTAFFDHSHSLPLQLLVELGVPLGLLVLGLLLGSLGLAARRAWQVEGEAGIHGRAAVVMLLLIGLHSLLEYPLWYAYFLLPAAWAWGFALVSPAPSLSAHSAPEPAPEPEPERLRDTPLALRVTGVVMSCGALLAALDYWRVVEIYLPSANAPSLAQRIERGQRSVFFRYQADYALVTTMSPADLKPDAFSVTTHALLDARLMMAWAKALEAQGRLDEARYVAARLKEFRNPMSKDFFAACAAASPDTEAPPPFQCQPPARALTWRDLLPRS
ncbi:MAG: Wzy polymerase domain-containing protein [Ideonella sp.]|nr:Wzy polymerase domain-containing protein [Ideonella sp.]